MTAPDEALRRELAEVVGAGFGHIPLWTIVTSLELADALIAGPIAKHTAALQAERDGARKALENCHDSISPLRKAFDDAKAANAALQADVARLTEEVAAHDIEKWIADIDTRAARFHKQALLEKRRADAAEARIEALEAENAALRAAPGAEAMRDRAAQIGEVVAPWIAERIRALPLTPDPGSAPAEGWRWVSEHGKPRTSPDHAGEQWLLTWSETSATYDVACIDGQWGPDEEISLLCVDAYRWLAYAPPPEPPRQSLSDAQEGRS